jgi:hypothetical protein
MNGAAWTLVVVAAAFVIGYVYRFAYARGYDTGQRAERRAIARVLDRRRQEALAAKRDIDYLYERARWQITSSGPASARYEGSHRTHG